MPPGYTIPILDLAGQIQRQIVVDREPGQYLGHPTTVLLNDNRSILAVYPKGHGAGGIVMKRSDDGGLTWSDRLPVPDDWATSTEVPTVYSVVDPAGVRRLIMFSGLYPIRMAVSEDEGRSWSGLQPIGAYGGIVAMASIAALPSRDHLAFWHDDGRFIADGGESGSFTVYQARSTDGGLTWGNPEVIAHDPELDLCEPGLVWSPDGTQMALLLRENSRTRNSYVIFSDDNGSTWSDQVELPAALTGDRHTARYAPDGRLFITFRDMAHQSPTRGDWVGWVGRMPRTPASNSCKTVRLSPRPTAIGWKARNRLLSAFDSRCLNWTRWHGQPRTNHRPRIPRNARLPIPYIVILPFGLSCLRTRRSGRLVGHEFLNILFTTSKNTNRIIRTYCDVCCL
jgi:hypothetical protein